MPETVLTSEWGKLSEHLVASFWEVDRAGKRVDPDLTLKAPLLDPSLEVTLNWQSPFENVGSDVLPTLQQLLSSGEAKKNAGLIDEFLSKFVDLDLSAAVATLEGKASITKLNSTQIFNGMPPIKFQVTLLFRAWKDAKREVEQPLEQFMKWALPVHLDNTTGLQRVSKAVNDEISGKEAFLPSQTPVFIAMKYKNRIYKPLVVESVSVPLSSPIDKNGNFVELSVPVQLASLAAIDRNDWASYKVQ